MGAHVVHPWSRLDFRMTRMISSITGPSSGSVCLCPKHCEASSTSTNDWTQTVDGCEIQKSHHRSEALGFRFLVPTNNGFKNGFQTVPTDFATIHRIEGSTMEFRLLFPFGSIRLLPDFLCRLPEETCSCIGVAHGNIPW